MQNHLRVIFAFLTASLPPSNISNTVSLGTIIAFLKNQPPLYILNINSPINKR